MSNIVDKIDRNKDEIRRGVNSRAIDRRSVHTEKTPEKTFPRATSIALKNVNVAADGMLRG